MISASGVYLVQGPHNRFITRALVRDDDFDLDILR